MPLPGQSNLQSRTGEVIQIHFSATNSGGTPGGGGVMNIYASNIACTLTVPAGNPLPDSYQWVMTPTNAPATTVILVKSGPNVYLGATAGPLNIRSVGGGYANYDDQQHHQFNPLDNNSQSGPSLTDPINGTSEFQTDFFYATAFATTPVGLWPVG